MARRSDHIEPRVLLGYAEGEARSLADRTHLERCAACALAFEEMQTLVADLRADRAPAPGEDVLRQAIALFPERPPAWRRAVESIAALMRGGAHPELAGAGVRGATASALRLLFAAGELQVDLQVEDGEGTLRVMGQVFGREPRDLPPVIWAERDGRPLDAAAIGDHGVFAFERLPRGDFDLVLDLGESRLRLPVRPGLP